MIRFAIILIGGVMTIAFISWAAMMTFGWAGVKGVVKGQPWIMPICIIGLYVAYRFIFWFTLQWCEFASKMKDREDKKIATKEWRTK
jgi:uncharacterized membrane protein